MKNKGLTETVAIFCGNLYSTDRNTAELKSVMRTRIRQTGSLKCGKEYGGMSLLYGEEYGGIEAVMRQGIQQNGSLEYVQEYSGTKVCNAIKNMTEWQFGMWNGIW